MIEMNKLFYNMVGTLMFPNFWSLILYEIITIMVELIIIFSLFDKDKNSYGKLCLAIIIANMISTIMGLSILFLGLGF